MKKFNWLFTALAGLVLTCCTGEDLSETPPVVKPPKQDVPILFSFTRGNTTRATDEYITGAEAAKLLGYKFVVTGFKGPETATPGSIVFDNYLVEYAENTANTTESNSSNWEYVNKGVIPHATTNGITKQTIKYWDYSVGQYDFFAWSTGGKETIYTGNPSANQVLVTNIQPNSKTKTWTEASGDDPARIAYTFTGTAAVLSQCYISDLVTVNKEGNAGVGEVTGYDQPVTLKFRQLGTKVRIGLYETIPGYSVRDVRFYTAAVSTSEDDNGQLTPTLFTTTANEIYTEGTYKVYFPTIDNPDDADNNQAHIKFEPKVNDDQTTQTQATTIDWEGLNYTIRESGEHSNDPEYIGRSSNTATFAVSADKNYYKVFLPNQNGTNLNLRVNYTLESIDGSGEKITVKGATATVPSIYTQWKAGYAYTYLFKISDKTNGYTGAYDPTKPDDITVNSDPAGLYPITFDAVVVNAEEDDQTQETITLVSTPSITTYQEGSNVVNNNEYEATNPIYVVVTDGNTENTPDLENAKVQRLTDKAVLYTIPAGKTEAEVVDALQMQDDDAEAGTIKGRSGLVLTDATTSANVKLTSQVKYGVDGNIITVGTAKVAKFTPAANTTYAFVYTKTNPTTTTEVFQPVTKAKGESVAGLYRWQMGNPPAGDVQAGVKYFYSGKSDQLTVFLGQKVNNLYLDDQGTIASGYAVTGTYYYYTTDKGMSYKKANVVTYEQFASGSVTLYTYNSNTETFTPKTETEPVDGTAYYTEESLNSYCVIYPQQTRPASGQKLVILNTSKPRILCADDEKASIGIEYFDKYTQNDGVYYTKVIKVQ